MKWQDRYSNCNSAWGQTWALEQSSRPCLLSLSWKTRNDSQDCFHFIDDWTEKVNYRLIRGKAQNGSKSCVFCILPWPCIPSLVLWVRFKYKGRISLFPVKLAYDSVCVVIELGEWRERVIYHWGVIFYNKIQTDLYRKCKGERLVEEALTFCRASGHASGFPFRTLVLLGTTMAVSTLVWE